VRSHLTATTPTPSLRSVLRLPRPFDVFLRARACRLISSRSHVQGPSRSGASLPAQPPFLFGRSCPRAVAPPHADRLAPAAAHLGPRLRGLHPRETAFVQHSYSPRCTPLPSSGSSPPGPHFTRSIAAYARSPLSTFLSPHLRLRDRASSPSSASLPREAWRCVSASPACSSFRAFLQISVLVTPTHRPLPCDEPVRDAPLSARLPSRRALLPERAPIRLPFSTRASRRLPHTCSIPAR